MGTIPRARPRAPQRFHGLPCCCRPAQHLSAGRNGTAWIYLQSNREPAAQSRGAERSRTCSTHPARRRASDSRQGIGARLTFRAVHHRLRLSANRMRLITPLGSRLGYLFNPKVSNNASSRPGGLATAAAYAIAPARENSEPAL